MRCNNTAIKLFYGQQNIHMMGLYYNSSNININIKIAYMVFGSQMRSGNSNWRRMGEAAEPGRTTDNVRL
jgi:hypothetical protein